MNEKEIAKVHPKLFKNFFSRTSWPVSSKGGTKCLLAMGIWICSNEGPHPFQKGDGNEERTLKN